MAGFLEVEADLSAALRRVSDRTELVEVTAQAEVGLDVRLDRTTTQVSPAPRIAGAVFRAWAGDHWEEVAASRLEPGPLSTVTDKLLDRLGQTTEHRRPPPGQAPSDRREAPSPPGKPLRDIDPDSLLELGRTWQGWALETAGIVDAQVVLGGHEDRRLYLNSLGGRRFQTLPRAIAVVVPIAMENGNVEYEAARAGGLGGAEVFKQITEEGVRTKAREALDLLHAAAPPSGTLNVILDPSTSGTFAHESFGHGTEADQFVRERSYLKPLFGSVVAPEEVSIIDDGSLPGGFGTLYFDDEGTPTQRTLLIDRGRFVGALHDRTTAEALGARPTGNARRSDYLSRVWVRMTNTMVAGGDRSLDELIQEARDGVLLETSTSGIEDPLGGLMQIRVKKGHRIEHGTLGRLVSSMALSGRVLDVLREIRGVGKATGSDVELGFCGKGHSDYIPVGSGGPYLLTRATVGRA